MIDQRLGALLAVLRPAGGQHRHEGLAEGAFAENPPEQVGNAESDIECVGQRADAEHRGKKHVAHEARDPRSERQQGYGGSGFEQGHGASVGPAKRRFGEKANPAYNGGLCCIILRHLRN